MGLGIDFGTTNTSAAFFDGSELRYIPLDPLNSSEQNLRSMIYIDQKQKIRLGTDAIKTFLRDDTGRPVIHEDKVVGTIENTVAAQEGDSPITIIYDVVINDDIGIRGRLLQSVKTALRSPSYKGTQVFDRFYTVEELIALILTRVREKSEAYLQQPVEEAVIGRPVTFTHDRRGDCLAEEKIRHAAKLAGFRHVTFVNEPVAAAALYLNRELGEFTSSKPAGSKGQDPHHHNKTILVFDFGGGTLDLTVLRTDATGQQSILSSVGILVGGDDLDTAIMRGKIAPYFGTHSAIDTNFDGRPIPFPEGMAEFLEQWQTIPTLTRPKYLPVIERAIQFGDNPFAFKALETLATRNYGFALFQEIERAKCDLSHQMHAEIKMQMDEIAIQIELSKDEFTKAIAQEKSLVRTGIRQAIAEAGLSAREIDIVVATGGSSSIPAFQALLKAEIPTAQLVLSDLFGSVTGGLAMHAHRLLA